MALQNDTGELCAGSPVAAGCSFPPLVALSDLLFPNPLRFVGVVV